MSERKAIYRTRGSEHDEQAAVIAWARLSTGKHPELALLFAIPNGAALSGGARAWKRLEAEGALPGVPDLFLPCARSGYYGLFIEMKIKNRKPRENQAEMLDALHEQGYSALVCYSAGEAIGAITEYLNSGSMAY